MIRYGKQKRRLEAGLERAMRVAPDPNHPLDKMLLQSLGDNAATEYDPFRPILRRQLRRLLAGDVGAAEAIACIAPNHWRAQIVRELWQAGLTNEPLRRLLQAVWQHDHSRMYAHCPDLHMMFMEADYPLPDWIGETVTAWRGAAGISPSQVAHGLSWTTDRATAGFFAIRYGCAPVVIKAQIPRENIAAYFDGRSENELIVIEPPTQYQVDGTAEEWRMLSKQRNGVTHDEHAAF